VFTLKYVAEKLGEEEGWLWDLQVYLEPEDGRLWVYDMASVKTAYPLSPTTASSASNNSLQTNELPAGHRPRSSRRNKVAAVLTACLPRFSRLSECSSPRPRGLARSAV
jgi:hypothetical protein